MDRMFLQEGIPLMLGQHGLFRSADEFRGASFALDDGTEVSGDAVLADLVEESRPGDSPANLTLMLVEPLAKLLFEGKLSELVFLARWDGALSMFQQWPSPQWAAATKGKYYVPPSVPIHLKHFQTLANDLRRWSGRLAPNDDGDEDGGVVGPNDDQQHLESHLRVLDSFIEELAPHRLSLPIAQSKKHRSHAGRFLLSMVLAGRLVKNPVNLESLMFDKLNNLLPTGMRSILHGLFSSGALQLPTWDHRLLLLVDTALMLYRREHVSNQAGRTISTDASCCKVMLTGALSHEWESDKGSNLILFRRLRGVLGWLDHVGPSPSRSGHALELQ